MAHVRVNVVRALLETGYSVAQAAATKLKESSKRRSPLKRGASATSPVPGRRSRVRHKDLLTLCTPWDSREDVLEALNPWEAR